MSLTIELSPEAEQWLEQEGQKRGLSKNQFATQLIEKQRSDPASLPFEELSRRRFESPELLNAYLLTANSKLVNSMPEEIDQANREMQELHDALDRNGVSFSQRTALP